MQIEQTRVMRGPNYWAPNRKKLIVLKLKMEERDNFASADLPEIVRRLQSLQPALHRLSNYQSLCDVVEQVAVELQCRVGIDCAYSKTHTTAHPDIFYVVFSYEGEQEGLYAGKAAVRIANAVRAGATYDLENDIQRLKQIHRREALGPSTRSIVEEAVKRGIPVTRLDRHSLVMLGQGCNQRTFRSTVASTTSNLAVEQASDKDGTKRILADNFIPVPEGLLVYDEAALEQAQVELGFPLVVKPLNGNHGRGITTGIDSSAQLLEAFGEAKRVSNEVIVERHIPGSDYRFLVVNFELIAVAKRVPARVTGDGRSTIQQLVDEVNKDPRRGVGHEMELTAIRLDSHTLLRLERMGLRPDSVLDRGEVLDLKDTANISTGGTAEDVTDRVHPDNVFLAERVARLMDLDICGIDIMAADISVPIVKGNGAVLEVNAGPGLRMHLAPTVGRPRNVAAPILDLMYPKQAPSRIPLVAVTGTNGKTTTVRLIAHLAKYAGHTVGFTTTDGIYIQDHLIHRGDCSGPASAAVVLRDPAVDFAVLECARGGILRSGLGFDQCNVSIVTNVSQDHLGLNDIETINQLARLKQVVPRSTRQDGTAILNADDDLVFGMAEGLPCNLALFAASPANPRIRQHVEQGQLAAVVEDGYLTIIDKGVKIRIASVQEVPLTLEGKSECMIMNILPSILTAYLYNFSIEAIQDALRAFTPSPENTPGRMNRFNFGNFSVMVDYAHNQGGFAELKKFAEKELATVKVGIIACPGDRSMDDTVMMGRQAAEIFDEVIIRHDKDTRGRAPEQITEWLMKGIKSVDPGKWVIVISDEQEALQYAMRHAKDGAWIFMNTEKVYGTLDYLASVREKDAVPVGVV
jgi:cyanophycin synthetase